MITSRNGGGYNANNISLKEGWLQAGELRPRFYNQIVKIYVDMPRDQMLCRAGLVKKYNFF